MLLKHEELKLFFDLHGGKFNNLEHFSLLSDSPVCVSKM